MENPKVLSGEELVAKGITKIDASLPEIGLKDVLPNGSWLEQKQIQAALEARKHLIEVERIEKCGTLSHAEWRDDINLAEVTQKAGGHWQYLGHNVGKTLYLRPEEALFLMEVNCLLLKHNKVTVSLQKAYSLLLQSSSSVVQYRVYSSLSRLGYKVFKHKGPNTSHSDNNNSFKDTDSVDTPVLSIKNDNDHTDSPGPLKLTDLNIDSQNTQQSQTTENNEAIESVKTNESPESRGIKEENNTGNGISNETTATMEVDNNVRENIDGVNHNVIQETVTECVSDNVASVIVKNVANTADGNGVNETVKNEDNMNVCTISQDKADSDIVPDDKENKIGDISTTTEEINAVSDVEMAEGNISAKDPSKDTSSIVTKELDPSASLTTDVVMDSGSKNVSDNVETEEIMSSDGVENSKNATTNVDIKEKCNNKKEYLVCNYLSKIDKLESRKIPPSDSKNIQKYFDNIPDLFKKQIVTVNVPDKKYIPQDIFVNCSSYLVDLQYIKERSRRPASSESAYTSSDEVNGTNVRRIRSASSSEYPQYVSESPPIRNPVMPRNNYYRSYGNWRPNNTFHYYQFNMIFHRPSIPNMFFPTRIQYNSRPHLFIKSPINNINNSVNHGSYSSNNSRKRTRNGRTAHLETIKNVAVRLKQMVISGSTQIQNLECLQNLLHSYNVRYKSKLRLTQNFEVVNEERIIETIELDDDEESKSKRPRLDKERSDKSEENLYRLRQFALRLKDLDAKDKATASHRRAINKAIKTYNKSYNADIYLNDNCEVIDRRFITLESSSESDCVVEEKPKPKKSKKLRNPFNILKRRSERMKSLSNPGTSKEVSAPPGTHSTEQIVSEPVNEEYSNAIVTSFNEAWLPNKNDFGRAEVVPKHLMNIRLIDSSKEQFLYDFMKDQYPEHKNWLEAKISFMKHLRESDIAFQTEQARILADSDLANKGLRPLIDSEDCGDMPTTMEKLRIIKNCQETDFKTSLTIHFDVYNRDVQNFRKKSPPKPHFRIICLGESSSFPTAENIIALHSLYQDNVAIVFAITGIESVSYLQINPIDLPIYTPKSDLV
ncbi:unnamed protein product [Chrysodeixis includens]|uniref:tRNA-splicing endonuclease subunit Sen54 N-terminal domain-containing protein n=1 Tax=Chrysodeixis includens TaxID=689277 RepID=A0A9P0BQ14_CHRIL|nr:unnamed protein product [Chrysodeixis includens]